MTAATAPKLTASQQRALDMMDAARDGKLYAYNGIRWTTIVALVNLGLVEVIHTAPLYSSPTTRRSHPRVIGTDWVARRVK